VAAPVKAYDSVPLSGAPALAADSTNVGQTRLIFPPSARVRTGAQYKAVFDSRLRVAHPLLNLYWRKTDTSPRLGLVVSRKVDKRAVGRNRIKRALRETMRHVYPALGSGDYVVLARPDAKTAENKHIRAAFIQLLRRSGALPLNTTSLPVAPFFHVDFLA